MGISRHGDGKPQAREPYEWKTASITVTGTDATTDITGLSGFTTLFSTVTEAHNIVVEASATAYIRLNSATNDKVTITATTPYTDLFSVVHDLYVSTGGAAVTITVKLK